ncbi:MAG TPA: stage V sporulation protein AE [Bacillus bacterium]|nr:stage V sporulation protein AE [Bacillus sp. (in: firmicutes)]
MEYIIAFFVGGFICMIGQVLLDKLKLSPSHLMGFFVVVGVILDSFGLYDQFIDFAGAGATVPISNLGHSLLHGAMAASEELGLFGIPMGMFQLASAGISSAILFSFLAALIFQPKG